MRTTISGQNFEHPADGWYMIEPKGEHPNAVAGIVQVIDDKAINSIVNQFNSAAAADKLSHGYEMLIDHEHFKHDTDKETRAYGWLQQLQNRDDGIYGKIRWTGTGKQAVDAGDYRYFSTEYDPPDLQVVDNSKPQRVRPLRLAGLSLTNEPNNKGGRPITNSYRSAAAVVSDEQPEVITNQVRTRRGQTAVYSPGFYALGLIVDFVRNRTGWTYDTVFNRVLRENRDLFRVPFDPTDHTRQFDRICNRYDTMRGGAPSCATVESLAKNVTQLTNRFFPLLTHLPVALQWDVLSRTVDQLEKCGVAGRLVNRVNGDKITDEQWKTVSDRTGDVLDFLEKKEAESDYPGLSQRWQALPARHKFWSFLSVVQRLMRDDGLSAREALQKIKETQPIFYAHGILGFTPEDGTTK